MLLHPFAAARYSADTGVPSTKGTMESAKGYITFPSDAETAPSESTRSSCWTSSAWIAASTCLCQRRSRGVVGWSGCVEISNLVQYRIKRWHSPHHPRKRPSFVPFRPRAPSQDRSMRDHPSGWRRRGGGGRGPRGSRAVVAVVVRGVQRGAPRERFMRAIAGHRRNTERGKTAWLNGPF